MTNYYFRPGLSDGLWEDVDGISFEDHDQHWQKGMVIYDAYADEEWIVVKVEPSDFGMKVWVREQ